MPGMQKTLPVSPVPHEESRPILLKKGRPDGLGKARIVELDAEIVFRRVAFGLRFPGRAEFGGAGIDAEVRRAVAFLLIVGDDLRLDVDRQGPDRSDTTVRASVAADNCTISTGCLDGIRPNWSG